MRDGVEVSLAAGVALRPGRAIEGEVTCCGCGLVHLHRYRLTKQGTLKLTAWRKDKHFSWVAIMPDWPGAYASHTDDPMYRRFLPHFIRREEKKGATVKRVTSDEAHKLLKEYMDWADPLLAATDRRGANG